MFFILLAPGLQLWRISKDFGMASKNEEGDAQVQGNQRGTSARIQAILEIEKFHASNPSMIRTLKEINQFILEKWHCI